MTYVSLVGPWQKSETPQFSMQICSINGLIHILSICLYTVVESVWKRFNKWHAYA